MSERPDYDAWARETPDTAQGTDETVARIEHWISQHPARAYAQRFPVDDVRALIAESVNLGREVERLQAWLCICPQVAPEHFAPDAACVVHGDPRTPHASARALTDAFEHLVMRIHRDFNFDAGECAPPEGETALRMMDDLVRYTEELSLKLETGEAL